MIKKINVILSHRYLLPVLFIFIIILLVQPAQATNDNQDNMEADSIFKIVSPAVFSLEIYDQYGNEVGQASGFIIESSGKAITNYHVIQEANAARAKLADGRLVNITQILYLNKDKDIAIIKLDGSDFPTVKLGNSDNILTGQKILVIGNPLGLENTISDGIISTSKRNVNDNDFIQITAPISSGSSGGVLLNYNAEVLGVTTMYFENGQNLNFAIPINAVKECLCKEDNARKLNAYQKILTQLIYDCDSFTLQYPSDWLIFKADSQSDVLFLNAKNFMSNVIVFASEDLKENETLLEYTEEKLLDELLIELSEALKTSEDYDKVTVNIQEEPIEINGNTFYTINLIGELNNSIIIQEGKITLNNNRFFFFLLSSSIADIKSDKEVFDRMLATLALKDFNQASVDITKKVLCNKINNNLPEGEDDEFSNREDWIYYYITFSDVVPEKITASWYYLNDGKRQFITGYDQHDSESNVFWFALPNELFVNRPGNWECQVILDNRIFSEFFTVFEDSSIRVAINGEFCSFPVSPVIENGRVLVPLRGISVALGANVEWDSIKQKAVLRTEDKYVELTIGQSTASTSNGSIKLDIPAKIIDNYTYVPLRFIGESLGANINWDSNRRIVSITN